MKRWQPYFLIGAIALLVAYLVFLVVSIIICWKYGIDGWCPNTQFAS